MSSDRLEKRLGKDLVTDILIQKVTPPAPGVPRGWQVYLKISDKISVKLDMLPGWYTDNGYRGKINLSAASYGPTFDPSVPESFIFPVLKPITPRAIADMMNAKGRGPYNLKAKGTSDEWCIFTIVYDLEEAHVIGFGISDDVWDFMKGRSSAPSGRKWDFGHHR